jgi:uncharacterized protein (TIGR02145 family)
VQTISFWLKTNDATNQKVIDFNGTAQMELDGAGLITATSWSSPTYYLDGVVDSRVVSSGWHHVAITTNTGISASNIEIGRVSTSYFNGTIDDVRIYNRVLSAAEVAELYQWGSDVLVDAAPYTPPAPPFTCGVSTISDADGNVYDTVEIGTQCWMKQNMRVGTMVTVATTQTNNATIEKWCYSDTLANCMTNNNPNYPDGGLYQWNEAMQYSTTPGARGICPAGWHIPTHDELTTLERAICTSGTCATDFPYDTTTTGYRGTTEGTKLKPNGTSGFEFNLAGYGYSWSFYRTSYGFVWSSSESGAFAWLRYVLSGSAQVYRDAVAKAYGFSVRCLKDS